MNSHICQQLTLSIHEIVVKNCNPITMHVPYKKRLFMIFQKNQSINSKISKNVSTNRISCALSSRPQRNLSQANYVTAFERVTYLPYYQNGPFFSGTGLHYVTWLFLCSTVCVLLCLFYFYFSCLFSSLPYSACNYLEESKYKINLHTHICIILTLDTWQQSFCFSCKELTLNIWVSLLKL